MSSKSSLFLTENNEHCYEETSEPHFDKQGKFIGYTIVLEIDQSSVINEVFEYGSIEHSFKPGTELYQKLLSLKGK